MGIFSKFIDELKKQAAPQQPQRPDPLSRTAPPRPQPAPQSARPGAPYAPTHSAAMPQEENQFSYPGAYYEYFAHVFSEEFPRYQIEEEVRYGSCKSSSGPVRTRSSNGGVPRASTAFIFRESNGQTDSRIVLVVDVVSEHSSSHVRKDACEAQGIPYLRFYYNHRGWWNTRSYVVDRVRNVLGPLSQQPRSATGAGRVIASTRLEPTPGPGTGTSNSPQSRTIGTARLEPRPDTTVQPGRTIGTGRLQPQGFRPAPQPVPQPSLPVSWGDRMPMEPNQYNVFRGMSNWNVDLSK